MVERQRTIGIQAVGLGGSFHEIAARDYFQVPSENELVPYVNHGDLIRAFHGHKVDEAILAVDNTTSGRVLTSVNALVGLPRNVHVVGCAVVPIEQRLLTYPGIPEERISALISQKPALDQCSRYIVSRGLEVIECEDTLQAAELVLKNKGIVEGQYVAAVASRMAGISNGLYVGEVINDRTDNATKFWRISREKDWDESGTHASITFDLPSNSSGALLRAIQIISSEHGYDLTDIDSHLHAYITGKRSFYAELLRPPNKNPKKLITALNNSNIRARLLGIYDSDDLVIPEDDDSMPAALTHDSWSMRSGLLIPDNSSVLHVEASNNPKALLGILQCLSGVSIEDLSRPTIPHGDRFSRGFYIVINSKSAQDNLLNAVGRLKNSGFNVSHFTNKDGRLIA